MVYPLFVYWENEQSFIPVLETSWQAGVFELSDILYEGLYGWDSQGRSFTIIWDEKLNTPRPVAGQSDLPGFRSAVRVHRGCRSGWEDSSYFLDTIGREVSPAYMRQALERAESGACWGY